MALARAATARVADMVAHAPTALIIRDTRESGEMLEAAVAAGVAAAGGEALIGGVLPTPGAPLLVRRHGLDLGVVLSASHNPFEDNGIKFFGGDGFKLTDDTEHEIERMLEGAHVEAGEPGTGAEDAGAPGHPTPRIGHVQRFHGALEDYLRALHERFEGLDLSGRRDRAGLRARRDLPRRAGDLPPPGRRGRRPRRRSRRAQHQRRLWLDPHRGPGRARAQPAASTRASRSTATATGSLAVDGTGAVVDGDELIALAALHLREQDRLPGDGVAVTVMTNYGFHSAMRDAGLNVATTAVGDRYVLEALRERDWALGGEQSGHIIDMGFNPTGDGIAVRAADARGAGRPRPRRPQGDGEAAAEARQRPRGRQEALSRGRGDVLARRRARVRGAGGPRPRAAAPERHRAASCA